MRAKDTTDSDGLRPLESDALAVPSPVLGCISQMLQVCIFIVPIEKPVRPDVFSTSKFVIF